jgi:hypothetical protein
VLPRTVVVVLGMARIAGSVLVLAGFAVPVVRWDVGLGMAGRTRQRRAQHGSRHRTPDGEQDGEQNQ